MSWSILGVCSDVAPVMLGSRSGFMTLVKENPDMTGTHCVILRQMLASKTLPERLNATLTSIIKIVNYVKGRAFTARLFRWLCEDLL